MVEYGQTRNAGGGNAETAYHQPELWYPKVMGIRWAYWQNGSGLTKCLAVEQSQKLFTGPPRIDSRLLRSYLLFPRCAFEMYIKKVTIRPHTAYYHPLVDVTYRWATALCCRAACS